MTSGVLKNYHGGPLRVPWVAQATAGGTFPWEPTHWDRRPNWGDRRPNGGGLSPQ